MKKSAHLFLTFAIIFFSASIMFGEDYSNNKYPQKLQFAPEKKAQIIKAAQKVAQEIAPKFRSDTLVAVIYSAPYSHYKDVIDVYFMKHEDDCVEYLKGRRDTVNKRIIIDPTPIRRPTSILTVTLYESSLEPASISDNYSRFILFDPNYADFRANHPDKQFEPYVYPKGEYIIF